MGSYKRTHTVEEQSFVPDAEIEMKIKHGKEVVMQKSCTEIFRIATLHRVDVVVSLEYKE